MRLIGTITLDYDQGLKRYHTKVTDEHGTFNEESYASSYVAAHRQIEEKFDKITKFIDLITAQAKTE